MVTIATTTARRGASMAHCIDAESMMYYTAFGIYLFAYCLGMTTFEQFLFFDASVLVSACRYLCVSLLAIKLVVQRLSIGQFFALLAVGAVVAASWYVSRDDNALLLLGFVIAGKGVSVKRLATIALVMHFGFLVLAVSFSTAGIIEMRYAIRYTDGIATLRSAMGYNHVNQFGQAVLGACCSYAITRFPRFRAWDLLVYALAALVCGEVADSRTSVVCIAILASLAIVSHFARGDKAKKVLVAAATVGIVACAALSFYMMAAYDPAVAWMRQLNEALSARFSLAQYYYRLFPPRLLGWPSGTLVIHLGSFTQHGPDNAYVCMLLQDGVLLTGMFLVAYVLTTLHFYRLKRYDACVFGLLLYAIVAVMEVNSLHLALNFCFVGVAEVIYGASEVAGVPKARLRTRRFRLVGTMPRLRSN